MQDRGLLTLTKLLLWTTLFVGTLQGVQGETDIPRPSESECQPYIEKALKKLETGDTQSAEGDTTEDDTTHLSTNDESEIIRDSHELNTDALQSAEETTQINDIVSTEEVEGSQLNEDDADFTSTEKHEIERRSIEEKDDTIEVQDSVEAVDSTSRETAESNVQSEEEEKTESIENSLEQEQEVSKEKTVSTENDAASTEQLESTEDDKDSTISKAETSTEQDGTDDSKATTAEQEDSEADSKAASIEEEVVNKESVEESEQQSVEDQEQKSLETEDNISVQQTSVEDDEQSTTEQDSKETTEKDDQTKEESEEAQQQEASLETDEQKDNLDQTKEDESEEKSTTLKDDQISQESVEDKTESKQESLESKQVDSKEQTNEDSTESMKKDEESVEDKASKESTEGQSIENEVSEKEISEQVSSVEQKDMSAEKVDSVERDNVSQETVESIADQVSAEVTEIHSEEQEASKEDDTKSEESIPVEDLTWEIEIPEDLRSRQHIDEIFHLNDEQTKQDNLIKITADKTLQELKRIYENAIKPLEVLYKYRDLSNRHFGDSEIFSKPLVLFMGPWSGGKSSIINYLLDNEYQQTSLRTGAEPSPAYFNLLSWGEKPEVQDGTQLAADWTFSGLQKFGQGLEERLRGLRLPSKLLEKINIVEIPGILEVRKQVSRMFPFNDACQWFIDRADIIFLVYDPSKLDVGPETEAILDQLKGREYQTRIILNKADQVKPEELMRVQGALIWNISPLMSSAQPPVMYSTSLWSRPYESGAPTRLLFAQERAFLSDLKTAIDKRIENKISSARRFAVRVRNHAKMVDCYLTTYYNHKSVFGNKKMVADQIIEHPQNYHIYEGLSTLTNISRYDLPDPDVYRDFFRLNPLYDFQQLSATCTYFRGCPINRLDIAIAYDLPELVGKYKKAVEFIQTTAETTTQS